MAFSNFLGLKYYERKLIDYRGRLKSQQGVLSKLCKIVSVEDYSLLPALISRKFSKIHYSKYLENTKLYEKLRSQFKDLTYFTQKIFDIHSSDQNKNFENLKNIVKKLARTFDINSEGNFLTESNFDEDSSEVGRWEGSTSRSNETNEMLDFRIEKINETVVENHNVNEAKEVDEMLNVARLTNELNLMAIEEFNNISNNLEIISLDKEDSDDNNEEEMETESYDENYDILEDIDGKIKMLENWFEE